MLASDLLDEARSSRGCGVPEPQPQRDRDTGCHERQLFRNGETDLQSRSPGCIALVYGTGPAIGLAVELSSVGESVAELFQTVPAGLLPFSSEPGHDRGSRSVAGIGRRGWATG
jgi:hypothetical protein